MKWNTDLLAKDYEAILENKNAAVEATKAEAETLVATKSWPETKKKAFINYAIEAEESNFANALEFFERYRIHETSEDVADDCKSEVEDGCINQIID